MKLAAVLVLISAVACATGSATSARTSAGSAGDAQVQACTPLVPRMADRGSNIYASPDSTSAVVTTLKADTSICTSADTEGFGFHRVRLANGSTGYVEDSSLIN